MVSGSISLPLPGFFSPFPHGTSSLSVRLEYLALAGSPACFPQGYLGLVVLGKQNQQVSFLLPTGLLPSMACLSRLFRLERKFLLAEINLRFVPTTLIQKESVWAFLCSLAATKRIPFGFFSSGY